MAQARNLLVGDTYTIATKSGSGACAASLPLELVANDVRFFDEQIAEVQKAVSIVAPALAYECPKLKEIAIDGTVSAVTVFQAKSKLDDLWKLSAQTSPLEQAAFALKKDVKDFEDIEIISSALHPYANTEYFDETFQYFLFASNAKSVISTLFQDGHEARFEDYIDRTYQRTRSAIHVKTEITRTIDTIALFWPQEGNQYRTIFDLKMASLTDNEWLDFLTASLAGGTLFDGTLAKIDERARLLPPSDALGDKLDSQLADWLSNQIEQHDTKQAESYKKIVANKRRISEALGQTALPGSFSKSQNHISASLSRLDKEIKVLTWDGFLANKLSPDVKISLALSNISTLAETLSPDAEHARQLDRKIFEWLKLSVSGAGTGDQGDYQASANRKRSLVTQLTSAELPDLFVASRSWIKEQTHALTIAANKIEWFGFLEDVLAEGDIYEITLQRIAAKTKDIPPDKDYAKQLDTRVTEWISEEISIYEGLMANGYLSDVAEKLRLAQAIEKTKLPAPFSDAQAMLTAEASRITQESKLQLAELLKVAKSIISDSGESYIDLADVIEETATLSGDFKDEGFTGEAEAITAFGTEHVENLLTKGLTDLKAELSIVAMTRETIAQYEGQANDFSELAQQFEAFDAYVIAIEDGIAAGRKKQCIDQYQRATGGQSFQINIGDGAVDLQQFACQLYANNHILEKVEEGGWLSSKSMTIDRSDGEKEQFELQRLDGSDVYYGAKRLGDNQSDVALDDWQSYITALVIPPPSGKPNARGVTECDNLSADPEDPNKVGQGLKLENQGEAFDFDRAIDACIAAIEYAPDQPRFYYQLARLLNFLGMAEEAEAYADIAVEAGYPSSFFLSAEMKMLEERDDAFFDAIDLLKLGAKAGDAASKAMLAELVPPGTDLFRPMPVPSDDAILNAYGRRQCSMALFGMQTCIQFTGIHSKECFQISEDEFSCELKLKLRCETSGDRMFQSLMQAACSTSNGVSDVQFRNLKKVGENKWRAYEPR